MRGVCGTIIYCSSVCGYGIAVKVICRSRWSGQSRRLRNTAVGFIKIPAILLRYALMSFLRADGSHTAFMQSCLLLRAGTRGYTAMAAVVADAIDSDVVDDGAVDVDISHDGGVHMADGAVVVEVIAAPVSAFISVAVVSVTVIHAAIESQMWSPVASVPHIAAAPPTPIARCP